MFGKTKQLERDIKSLRESIEALERKSACRDGSHLWVVDYEAYEQQAPGLWFTVTDSSKPFMRCKHCYVRKEPKVETVETKQP